MKSNKKVVSPFEQAISEHMDKHQGTNYAQATRPETISEKRERLKANFEGLFSRIKVKSN